MKHSNKKISATVVGASGYSGQELTRLLGRHPSVKITALFASPSNRSAHSSGDKTESALLARMTGLPLCPFSVESVCAVKPDVIFFATPNEASHELIPAFMTLKTRIIDLSGSFRLRNAALYPQWYGFQHAAPGLLKKFVYGLPELNAQRIRQAHYVANPGCYATAAALPLLPIVRNRLFDPKSPIICDSKSGVSGAGKQPTTNTHFCEVSESFKAYSVFSHRHLPEIEQAVAFNGSQPKIIFTPHLLPINRGLLTTIYVRLKSALSTPELSRIFTQTFRRTPFVRLFHDELPQIKFVTHTNYCDIGWRVDEGTRHAIFISCLDNLVKGAAGQAVQNMNLMFGLDERLGLQ